MYVREEEEEEEGKGGRGERKEKKREKREKKGGEGEGEKKERRRRRGRICSAVWVWFDINVRYPSHYSNSLFPSSCPGSSQSNSHLSQQPLMCAFA